MEGRCRKMDITSIAHIMYIVRSERSHLGNYICNAHTVQWLCHTKAPNTIQEMKVMC